MTKSDDGLIDKTDFENSTWNNWKKTEANQPGDIVSRNGNYCASFSVSDILNTTLRKSWELKLDTYYTLIFKLQTSSENNHYSTKWNDQDMEKNTPIPVGSTWTTASVPFKTSPFGVPTEDTIDLTIERGTADNVVLLDNLELYEFN